MIVAVLLVVVSDFVVCVENALRVFGGRGVVFARGVECGVVLCDGVTDVICALEVFLDGEDTCFDEVAGFVLAVIFGDDA